MLIWQPVATSRNKARGARARAKQLDELCKRNPPEVHRAVGDGDASRQNVNNLARTHRTGTSVEAFHPKLTNPCLALFAMLLLGLAMPSRSVRADDIVGAHEAAREPGPARSYDELVHAAIASQEGGDFTQAYALFESAHRRYPNARTLRAMGVAAFQAGHFVDAVTHLEASLSHPEKPLDSVLRAAVSDLLQRARAQLASYRISAEPDTALLSIDGDAWRAPPQEPLLLLPGEHVLTLHAEGFEPQSLSLTATAGAAERIRISLAAKQQTPALTPEPSPASASPVVSPSKGISDVGERLLEPGIRRRRRASLALAGVGGAAVLTAVGLWYGARHRVDVIAQGCRSRPGNGCTVEERDFELERANLGAFEVAITSAIVVASASVLGAAGIWWWNRVQVTPRIETSTHGACLGLVGRF